jgi:hypothetical protein
MKGKYITTSLRLAVLADVKNRRDVIVAETPASTKDHTLIWSKTVSAAKRTMLEMAGGDELKMA